MPVLKSARYAVAAAALAMLPVHAAAAAPATLPALAASAALQGETADDGHPFLRSEYLVPTLIVIALAVGLYFILEDGGDAQAGPPTSP